MGAQARWFAALVSSCLAVLTSSVAAQLTVRLDQGRLVWRAGETELGAGAAWLQVRDVAAGETFVDVPLTSAGTGFRGTAAELRFEGAWKPVQDAWELTGTVSAQPALDRALVVRVALPLAATGWSWWDDMVRQRPIVTGQRYTYVLNWGGLREVSAYPYCAVSGPALGVSLAVPLHEPRVWRLAYDAARQTLEAEFDVGLSPDAAKSPCRADLRLLVYAHDPAWGFRSAIERYYRLFPQYAERRLGAAGIWLLSLKPGSMACPWDWGLKFDEGAQQRAGYDQAHDILPFVYTECWGIYEGFGDRPPPDGKDRYGRNVYLLPPAEMKQSIVAKLQVPAEQTFWGPVTRREAAQAEINSAIEDAQGGWIWSHYTQTWSKGNFLSNLCLNPDPDLPPPSRASVTWDGEINPAMETARRNGGELGGVYLDSVCGYVGFFDESFRRDHWRYADTGLVASYKAKQPVQLHAFSCFEIGDQIAQRMRQDGKFVIGNTGRPEMAYFCPLLDMIGTGEHGMGLQADEHYTYMRAYGYHKPMSPMAYELVNPDKPWAEKERAMQRMLFYAVHPGTGPFEEPLKYEPSRPLFRFYEPLIAWLDLAGWQPVTRARATAPGLLVERYGPGPGDLAGVTFIAVRNPGQKAVTTDLRVDDSEGGAAPAGAVGWLLLTDRPAQARRDSSGWLAAAVAVPADGTEVLAIGRRDALARLWLHEAELWLERLAKEARWLGSDKAAATVADGDFEGGLTGWGLASPPSNQRDSEVTIEEERPISGKRSARIQSHSEQSLHGLNQNPIIASGEGYTLRFKYSWTRPEGATGTVVPRFGVKGPDGNWATDKYVYFNDLRPTGASIAAYEGRFTIPADCTAGFFQFMFSGQWGTFVLDGVELTSETSVDVARRLVDILAEAQQAADALRPALAQADTAGWVALAGRQEPVYRRLLDLAQGLPEGHLRRCLLLPVRNLAVSLGQATAVLTGVTLDAPAGLPFADGPLGGPAALACTLTAGTDNLEEVTVALVGEPAAEAPQALKAGEQRTAVLRPAMPATAPWGWEDVFLAARFKRDGESVWLPRRTTLRLHPALEVTPMSALGGCSQTLGLSLNAWLPGKPSVELTAVGTVGDLQVRFDPVRLELQSGVAQLASLPIPKALAARLDEFAACAQACKVAWTATPEKSASLQGVAEVALLRGTRCPQLTKAPQLDGRLTTGEWAGAAEVQGFVNPGDGKPTERRTTVRIGHHGGQLCLAFVCAGQGKPVAQERGPDGAVWEDDAVEVFLQAPGGSVYYHFGVNAAGSRYDARGEGSTDSRWSAPWTAAAGVTEGGWVVEIAIPLSALGAKAEGVWRANFGREEADTHRASCWSPTLGSFHTPARFGEMGF
jgi:hypothetical protein